MQLLAVLGFMQDTELHYADDARRSPQQWRDAVAQAADGVGDKYPYSNGTVPGPGLARGREQMDDPGYQRLLREQQLQEEKVKVKGNERHSGEAQDLYTLEQSSTDPQKWCIHYPAPASAVPMLMSRPILACGGVFEVREDRGFSLNDGNGNVCGSSWGSGGCACRGVYIEATTSDPKQFAYEIGRRLAIRIDSDGASVSACPMA